MPSSLPTLIFDLDGTLTDSKPGIVSCLRKALDDRNMGDCGPLDRFIGPPVEEWTVELLPDGTEEERAQLVLDYRDYYGREGWNNNSVYPGVKEMIVDLHGKGFPLYVCTSKAEHYAVRILELFELSKYFIAIYGDRVEYTDHAKSKLLGRLLSERALNPDSVWMIGDRTFDFEAARANNIPSIAAGWGYGTPQEIAQATAIAATPANVYAIVAQR